MSMLTSKRQISRALRTVILSAFMMFALAGCAPPTLMPDVAGLSPYKAKQLLEQDVSDAQINFATIKGTDVAVENADHYSGWEVVATEPSAETALSDEGNNKILVTIKMTELEAERRNTAILDHIQNEAVSGWPEGSITYYDSDELLTLRYQGEGGAPEGDTSLDSKLVDLAESLDGTILATYYTDDNYLEAIRYYSHGDAPSDQLSRAEEETARMVEEADLHAAQHLDAFLSDRISESFPPDFGDPPMWKGASYAITEQGVVIKVVLSDGYSFAPQNTATPYTMDELADSWRKSANALTFYTQTGVHYEFYSSSGDLELAVASEGIKGYDIWNQTESTVLLPH